MQLINLLVATCHGEEYPNSIEFTHPCLGVVIRLNYVFNFQDF